MNSSLATSAKPYFPGRRGKPGWQSNGVSVMGPQSGGVLFPRLDRAVSLDGARRGMGVNGEEHGKNAVTLELCQNRPHGVVKFLATSDVFG